jgi:Ca-activated chloride channel homolog
MPTNTHEMKQYVFFFSALLLFATSPLFSQARPGQKKPVQQTVPPPKPKEGEYVPPTTRILFILDASNSMMAKWEKDLKINIAKKTLNNFVDSLEKNPTVQMALRVYGHQSYVPPQDCNDTKLEVPFGPKSAPVIRQRLKNIECRGTTPIANSLKLAGKDFPPCDKCRNVIILITDGIEACEGDPCAVSAELQAQGIILRPFIIGIGIDENFKKSFECVGKYMDAPTEESFETMLNIVITEALNQTTAQVNLLDIRGLPNETNVNMTFYDKVSGKAKFNFVHTMNFRGFPDTLILDPLLIYRLVVNTIPPVIVDSIKLNPGRHNIIAASTPQGYLQVRSIGDNKYLEVKFIIRKSGDSKTLNNQKLGDTEKYLVGRYDLEVPVLPILNINNIEIKQSTTTTIDIPRPGIVNFQSTSPGYGSVYVMRNKQQEWVCNLKMTSAINESAVLQPGNYIVVFRAMYASRSTFTTSQHFEVQSGSTLSIRVN